MTNYTVSDDRQLDRNLTAVAARLALPPEPSVQQYESWKGAGRGAGRRKPVLLASSAVAAAVAMIAFFVTPTQHSVVEAGTIWRTFREAAHQGIRLTLQDIGAVDDARVGGHVNVLFQQPVKLGQLLDEDKTADVPVEGVYGELELAFGENAEELRGLNLSLAFAISDTEQWVYLRSDDPTALSQAIGPLAALVFQPLRNGVLLDLHGLADIQTAWHPDVAGDADVAASEDEEADEEPGTDEAVEAEAAGDSDITALLRRFLSGGASVRELEALGSQLEQAAAHVQVDQRSPGVYVLTARDFSAAAQDNTEPWLAEMVLEIAYCEGSGIEWAQLLQVGELHGSIKLDFIAEPVAADRLSRGRYECDGVTTVLDVGGLIRSLEGLGGTTE